MRITSTSTSEKVPPYLVRAVPAATLRASCVALFVGLSACGGGDEVAPVSSPPLTSAQNPSPQAPGTTQPPQTSALVVGTALSIDSAASGNPVNLRVVLSANGDGFVVWQAHDGTRHNLWANRYRATTATWGSPVSIEACSGDIDEFDLTVDATGNAVVAWHEVSDDLTVTRGTVRSTRFAAGAGAWSMPVVLHTNSYDPHVASAPNGNVLALYVAYSSNIRGRFFDPVSGTWQPEAAIEQNSTGTGFSSGPAALLDGSGNALAIWRNARTGASLVASNYFSSSTGGWDQLPPDEFDLLGVVPGSLGFGFLQNIQLAASSEGNFLAAWQSTSEPVADPNTANIFIAHFTSGTRTWSRARTLVPSSAQNNQLQRIASDAGGNALLLWTENSDMRTALKAVRLDPVGTASGAVQEVDSAVGGGAVQADLGVDPLGHAIAIWQQSEGGGPGGGSRTNIVVNGFDGSTATWGGAVLAETQPGNAIRPRASATGGQALLGWIQSEDGTNRVKAVLQSLDNTSTTSP